MEPLGSLKLRFEVVWLRFKSETNPFIMFSEVCASVFQIMDFNAGKPSASYS